MGFILAVGFKDGYGMKIQNDGFRQPDATGNGRKR